MATFPFNFKKQFEPDIRSGRKLQTIRQNRKDGRRPVRGDTLRLYVGLRTRKVRLIVERTCTDCKAVRIDTQERSLTVDGHRLSWAEQIEFAHADGFKSVDDFYVVFREQYGNELDGFLVGWGAPC